MLGLNKTIYTGFFILSKSCPHAFHSGIWISGGILHPFLSLVVDGGKWSASHPSSFICEDTAPQYPSNMRLGEPHSKCEEPQADKNLMLLQEMNHDSLVVQTIA
jgi:hypothetical protein